MAEETLKELAAAHNKQVATHLFGQEINAETFAICKADLLLHGEGEAADNIVGGPEHSTLANDAFPSREFDFMLSNPPYGKSWKSDLERMGGKQGMKDLRFTIEHNGVPEYSLVTRSSDGQMLFLANMLSKMKQGTKLGSRIAEVHNGSSLFTGDAGQGESNIRRWIIENDWLEAIVALPLNMFYNTGIATLDFNTFLVVLEQETERQGLKLTAKRKKLIQTVLTDRDEAAKEVIAKVHKRGKVEPDPLHGLFEISLDGKPAVVEYEPDSDLRDSEQVPLLEEGGIEAFLGREVLPHAPDAWYTPESVRIGYEISFTRYFYKPQPLRTLEEIRADILALEKETEGLLDEIMGQRLS